MDSIIELQRQNHEEIERFERALYTLLSRHQPTHESRLLNEHKSAQVLDRISSRVTALNNIYADEDARNVEINILSAPQQQNDLSEFYSRLVKIQEHHSKYPDATPGGFDLELAALLEEGNQDDDEEEEDRKCIFLNHLKSAERVFSHCTLVLGRGGLWKIRRSLHQPLCL